MAIHYKERPDLWVKLFTLANKDEALLRDAALHAMDDAGRIHLRIFKDHILNHTDPALRATFEAACKFTIDVDYQKKLPDLPHLQAVYNMAVEDISSPSRIFGEAARHVRDGKDIPLAIHNAICTYTIHRHYHSNHPIP